MAVDAQHIGGQVNPRLHRAEEDLLEGGREALTVAGEGHLVHKGVSLGHILDHVQERVVLHLDAAVRDHDEVIFCRHIAGMDVVNFRIDAHIGAAHKELGIYLRVLVQQLLHQLYGWVVLFLHAK